jgi:hypothetical protein
MAPAPTCESHVDYSWKRGAALEEIGEPTLASVERRKAIENCEAALRMFPQDTTLLQRCDLMKGERGAK